MYQQATQAYQNSAKNTADPRELEAELLMKAAARLTLLKNDWDNYSREDRNEVLIFNRKLWTIFTTDATAEESPLPPEIKTNIGNLGVFIMRETMNILARPNKDSLDTLININRAIAAGLRGQTEPPAQR
ncbi:MULTISPECIES: flagellar biosynthesis regulator FlaF [Pseudovibrio]|uniref:flagellar biosynthesis regulator FlaF n=1 Tax=Stappiaceae TaxID=2821832 RepID=UPI002365656F|nr:MULTISPECIES: flagellar biosynthesis regulator FlaF [Pseudovibrio]MDD7910426.1 flagellar biosynthesis regulator FlaF [Pseudovibrio exalbescens]MDX5594141.1 flagellar biosynthesis regulator FlaF [Pseudovibrio sp. SPO723]